VQFGIEGTGSFGAGLTRFLRNEGCTVVEVNRPNRQTRRSRGKSDPVDAEARHLSTAVRQLASIN
jgi:transposase